MLANENVQKYSLSSKFNLSRGFTKISTLKITHYTVIPTNTPSRYEPVKKTRPVKAGRYIFQKYQSSGALNPRQQ